MNLIECGSEQQAVVGQHANRPPRSVLVRNSPKQRTIITIFVFMEIIVLIYLELILLGEVRTALRLSGNSLAPSLPEFRLEAMKRGSWLQTGHGPEKISSL